MSEGGLSSADVLQITVEEYRFQVRLNADRINYWYTLNLAILIAAATLGGLVKNPWITAPVFLLATWTSSLCAVAAYVQHGYYKEARDRALRAAADAGAPDLLTTTPGMRGERAVRVKVQTVTVGMFIALALVGVAGAAGTLITV